jgi:hypothetical protein
VLAQGSDLAHAPRWPRGPGGVTVIHYNINTRGAVTSLDDAHVISAIRAGFATWQTVVPSVRFVYDGTTLSPPISGDGQNVVGFGDVTSGSHLGQATTRPGPNGEILEADMLLAAGRANAGTDGFGPVGWTWLPCGTAGKPCTDVPACTNVTIIERCDHDLQNAVTHEVGHWLFLGDLRSPQDTQMTMYGSIGATASERFVTERHKVTLALGDVIGARALYPCGCAIPKIEDP